MLTFQLPLNMEDHRLTLMLSVAVIGGLLIAFTRVYLAGSGYRRYSLPDAPQPIGYRGSTFNLGRIQKGTDLVASQTSNQPTNREPVTQPYGADTEFKNTGSFQLIPRGPGVLELFYKHYRSETLLMVASGPEAEIRTLKQELNESLFKRVKKPAATA